MAPHEGKRVVITGGTSGIGLATARVLLDGGARVLVTGRTPASLDNARAVLGPRAIVETSDAVSDIDTLSARVAAEFGSVDLLVLNAGATAAAAVGDTSEAMYDQLFAVNAKAPFFTLQKFLPLLPAGSAVVLTTSVSNAKGIASTSVYSATKAALRSMTRTFARELVDRGIRVNAVSPGPIDTGILERTMSAEAAQEFLDQVKAGNPMRRFGTVEEVAKAIVFLGFDATYTTGSELLVDGGASDL
ncbi:short-chain dehydrogenase [Mycolicibacterium conceptionense]|uniref:Short-chain dehydrogenase n=1 Tax=Mycolicibacterium conceptionense TaxID=451644 RepID=A0A1A1Z5H2_9MYCO|nr:MULTISPECIES: SDR family oxidoreductase [Mycolicibacterium]MCW1824838.1 SDR family oxidoreductase [Mycolicibacterium senegalense]OBB06037.1 short-chain dehydrogenase [Mycolicibacterium conceptionense]OBF06595.1 short-chain dehydrogenase [Mycolicibacterium conceptionense]OBF19455.1 short-chain dehydrogenase [Mycolicibacterium conceptionense]OBF38817.1 short-chain dehydrogenase [Mycolicibacterium conceptionense]